VNGARATSHRKKERKKEDRPETFNDSQTVPHFSFGKIIITHALAIRLISRHTARFLICLLEAWNVEWGK